MKSKQFERGDEVVTLVPHEHFEAGTVGTVTSRLIGTLYAVKLPNGDFHWVHNTEIAPSRPEKRRIVEGDVAMMISETHPHPVKIGDLVEVYKIVEDVDYYGVLLDDELHWLAGFELAKNY